MLQIVHGIVTDFEPPPFDPHPLIRGGHLQTLATVRLEVRANLTPQRHVVELADGDAIVLHEDCPVGWKVGDPSMLLIHGLTGCHDAPYMVRLAAKFFAAGTRVFRMDMRGCGAARHLAQHLTHAGRSDDVIAALDWLAEKTQSGPIGAVGVSMGGNQLLRAFGRLGGGIDSAPRWIDRIARIAAVSPPVNLQRCSDQMQRWINRPYNFYFIRALLARVPTLVSQREDYVRAAAGLRPRTLRQLDDQITAPLSGFADAAEYYHASSACRVSGQIQVPTLVLAADNDPIVPVECFRDDRKLWSDSTTLVLAPSGGHVGFINRQRDSWMDQVLLAWLSR